MTFKGYYTGKNVQSDINVYIANESGTAFKGYDVTGMTQYSGVFDMTNGGGSSSNPIDVITVTFPEGIVYNGENIRIVTTAESDGWQSVYFEVDNNYSSAAQQKAHDSGSLEDLEAGESWSALSYMPVAYFAVEKDATTISGTVTAKESGAAIEGAEVKLTSGDVEYAGTTGADGRYEFAVKQDALTYDMEVAKEGYFTYRSSGISFAEGSAVKDVEMDEATGINIVSVSIPTEGEVNSTMTVKANIENGLEKEAGSYTAVLYVDGAAAAEAEAVALEAYKSYEFAFNYTPHAEGEVNAYVEFVNEYNTATSEPQAIAIAAESANAEVRVGTPTEFSTAGPIRFYDQYTQTEIIYPKEMISLEAGAKILSISFKGYTDDLRTADPVVNVWIGNVPEGSALQGEDVTELTQVTPEYGTMVTIEPAGSESEPIAIFTAEIPDGFTYEGGDIRIFTQSESDAWTYTYFEIDNNVQGQAQQRYDYSSIENVASKSWTGIEMPVRVQKSIPYGVYRRIWHTVPFSYNMLFPAADLNVFFNFIVPPRVKGKVITVIYDMTYLRFPETMNESNLRRIQRDIGYSVARSDKIVTISAFSKSEIHELLHVPEEKIEVVYSAPSVTSKAADFQVVQERLNVRKPYVLYVGTIEPRKNLVRLIQAFDRLKKEKQEGQRC